MGTPADKSGRVDLVAEGYKVRWDEQGVEVRVTEHHDRVLRLPWALLRDLAGRAGVLWGPRSDDPGGTGASLSRETALAVLDLPATASDKEIKRAHGDLVKIWHPDRFRKNARLRAKAKERLKRIEEAFAILKGPAHADQEGAAGAAGRKSDVPGEMSRSIGDETVARPVPIFQAPEGSLALLVLEPGSRPFPIGSDSVLVGRYDPVTGTRPEVDLSQVDMNRSVSRRHARIVFKDGAFVLTEEEPGTLNGTFVNGRRLEPGQPALLQSGDTIGFGTISMVFRPLDAAVRRPAAAAR